MSESGPALELPFEAEIVHALPMTTPDEAPEAQNEPVTDSRLPYSGIEPQDLVEYVQALDATLGKLLDMLTINPSQLDAAVEAYTEAWEAKRHEIGRGIAQPGTKTRAGLLAAFATLGIALQEPEGTDWKAYAADQLSGDNEKLARRL